MESFAFILARDGYWTCSCGSGDGEMGRGDWRDHLQRVHIGGLRSHVAEGGKLIITDPAVDDRRDEALTVPGDCGGRSG